MLNCYELDADTWVWSMKWTPLKELSTRQSGWFRELNWVIEKRKKREPNGIKEGESPLFSKRCSDYHQRVTTGCALTIQSPVSTCSKVDSHNLWSGRWHLFQVDSHNLWSGWWLITVAVGGPFALRVQPCWVFRSEGQGIVLSLGVSPRMQLSWAAHDCHFLEIHIVGTTGYSYNIFNCETLNWIFWSPPCLTPAQPHRWINPIAKQLRHEHTKTLKSNKQTDILWLLIIW
jgi:hypothetical protein